MRNHFTMAETCSRNPYARMTIDGETFPVTITNISCDSSDPYDSTTVLTVEIGGHHHTPYHLMSRNRTNKPEIARVIFNNPATIVFWSDGTKTVVKCDERDEFDPEKGLAMAIAKKSLGNNYKYYEVFEKFLPRTCEEKTIKDVFSEMMSAEAVTVAEKIKEKIEEQKELRDCSSCNYVGCSPKSWPCSPCLSKCLAGEPRTYWTRKEV